ncbi:MAG: hypothetical protein C5B46_04520 [Proteobacteria bacterium]|nr:MAG: hypothetical protein C5B46_04520 [Pseudomonadota bacterium]
MALVAASRSRLLLSRDHVWCAFGATPLLLAYHGTSVRRFGPTRRFPGDAARSRFQTNREAWAQVNDAPGCLGIIISRGEVDGNNS